MAELVRPGGTVAIVGFANPSGPADWAYIVAGFLLTRVRGAVGHYWEHHAPIRWPPPLTMHEMRRLVDSEMPGATFGRDGASLHDRLVTASILKCPSRASDAADREAVSDAGSARTLLPKPSTAFPARTPSEAVLPARSKLE